MQFLIRNPLLALTLSTILWAMTGVCMSNTSLSPAAMLGARGVVALLVVLPLMDQLRKYPTGLEVLAGVTGALVTWFFFLATRAANGAADLSLSLLYTTPFWSVILGRMMGRKYPWWYFLIALMAAAGVAAMATSWENANALLVVYGVLGAICFAVMGVSIETAPEKSDRPLIYALGLGVLIGLPDLLTEFQTIFASRKEFGLVVLCGAATAGGYILLTRSLRKVSTTAATVIQSGEVPLVLLLLWALGMRQPTSQQLLGMGLVLLSSVFMAIHMRRK